jgi:cytochrome P450
VYSAAVAPRPLPNTAGRPLAHRRAPPGPSPEEGHRLVPRLRADPLRVHRELAARFGPVARFRAGLQEVWVLSDPRLCREVLLADDTFARLTLHRHFGYLLGRGLLTSHGGLHRDRRSLVLPSFRAGALERHAGTMATLARQQASGWVSGAALDAHAEMAHLSMATIISTLCAVDPESSMIHGTLKALDAATDGMGSSLSPEAVAADPATQQAVRTIRTAANRLVARRREHPPGDDLLSRMISSAEDGRISPTDLRDEVINFLQAGTEPTAALLTWTLRLLAGNPEVQARVQAEADSAAEPAGRHPAKHLPYLERVLTESLRIYPPVGFAERTATRRAELGGYRVPKGTTLVVSQSALSHDPERFPQPDRLDPERWTRGRAPRGGPGAFLPFGAGVHRCVGAGMAWMEALIVLATLARDWSVDPVPGSPSGYRLRLTMRPTPAHLVVHRRPRESPPR